MNIFIQYGIMHMFMFNFGNQLIYFNSELFIVVNKDYLYGIQCAYTVLPEL